MNPPGTLRNQKASASTKCRKCHAPSALLCHVTAHPKQHRLDWTDAGGCGCTACKLAWIVHLQPRSAALASGCMSRPRSNRPLPPEPPSLPQIGLLSSSSHISVPFPYFFGKTGTSMCDDWNVCQTCYCRCAVHHRCAKNLRLMITANQENAWHDMVSTGFHPGEAIPFCVDKLPSSSPNHDVDVRESHVCPGTGSRSEWRATSCRIMLQMEMCRFAFGLVFTPSLSDMHMRTWHTREVQFDSTPDQMSRFSVLHRWACTVGSAVVLC